MMTLTEWVEQLPENWHEDNDFSECALCHEDEVWDYNLCVACVEELNENENDGWWEMSDSMADANTLASIGWGTDEDYGYYGE